MQIENQISDKFYIYYYMPEIAERIKSECELFNLQFKLIELHDTNGNKNYNRYEISGTRANYFAYRKAYNLASGVGILDVEFRAWLKAQ